VFFWKAIKWRVFWLALALLKGHAAATVFNFGPVLLFIFDDTAAGVDSGTIKKRFGSDPGEIRVPFFPVQISV
jgi:hypothetical protein